MRVKVGDVLLLNGEDWHETISKQGRNLKKQVKVKVVSIYPRYFNVEYKGKVGTYQYSILKAEAKNKVIRKVG